MKRNLKTVAALAADSPFTESQLRWWIFQERNNGMAAAGVAVRVGRRVYLDVDAFDRWIDEQQQKAAA